MSEGAGRTIEVEIVYASAHEQIRQMLRVPVGTTIAQAIDHAGIALRYPEVAEYLTTVGIFGRRSAFDTVLHEFDRIELYRPLSADPKQARRARAQKAAKSPR
jgi:hypothetical protein